MNYKEDEKKETPKKFILELNKFINDNNNENSIRIGNWDGGGDSGYVSIDDNFPAYYVVENIMDNILDYGSWAGEFTSTGEIYYNKEDQNVTLVGTEELDNCIRKNIKINFDFSNLPNDINYIVGEYEGGILNLYWKNDEHNWKYYDQKLININEDLYNLLYNEIIKLFDDNLDYSSSCFDLEINRINNVIEDDVYIHYYEGSDIYHEITIDEIINQISYL
jgi:hypothetical protein